MDRLYFNWYCRGSDLQWQMFCVRKAIQNTITVMVAELGVKALLDTIVREQS